MEKLKKLSNLKYLILALMTSVPATAMGTTGTGGGRTEWWGELIPNTTWMGIGNLTDIPKLVSNIIRILLILAGLVVFIYLVIGGYQYATAGGNAEQATAARTTILNAIIGVVIVFASYALVTWFMTRFVSG